jgi:hypothetical protein
MELKRNRILRVLKYFDSLLPEELEIILCGGAACLVRLGFERGTQDIDVITSIPKLSLYSKEIKKVAEKYGLANGWLNDSAKGYIDMAPLDFRDRLKSVEFGFKNLKVFALAAIDIYIMKLAAFRPQDIQDLTLIKLNDKDIAIIYSTVKRISEINQKRAIRMKYFLEEKGLWKS